LPLHHTQLVLNRPTTDRVIFPLTFGGVGHPQLEFLGVSGHPRHPQWLRHWLAQRNSWFMKTRPGYKSRNRCSFSRFLKVKKKVLRWHRPLGSSICERRYFVQRHRWVVNQHRIWYDTKLPSLASAKITSNSLIHDPLLSPSSRHKIRPH